MFDGLKAVFIGVYATPTANPLTVITDVRKAFPEIQRELPPGLDAAIAYDATNFIRASLWEVMKTLGEAAIIVIVVIFLFLGNLRSTIIPIITIPLSLVGVLAVAAGARLLDQPDDAARAGARHRARGRRRHRRGGEHLPAYRGRQDALRSRAARRARDPLPGHRHDHYAWRRCSRRSASSRG